MTMNDNLLRQLSQEITDVKRKLRTKNDLERSLARVRQTLQEKRRKLWELETRLAEESADVEALEKLSLQGLFLSILGNREEQLKEEQQELLLIKLKHDECQEAIEKLEQQVEDLERQVERLGQVLNSTTSPSWSTWSRPTICPS